MKPLDGNSTDIRMLPPMMLRIALSLILWTLGAGMSLAAAEPQEHRAVYHFAAERAKVEDLQRWVNSGHDPWCRDPQQVAAASLRRMLAEDSEVEVASLPVELERNRAGVAVYTLHSLDGTTTYRIVLRRYRWLLPVAGSRHKMIWVPERVEIITKTTLHSSSSSRSQRKEVS